MVKQICRWHSFGDAPTLQRAVVRHIATCASTAIAERGMFRCVLAGGRTPEAIYRQLVELETNWSAWSIYFGDERCLPDGDPQRNDTMARGAWLDRVAIPPEQIHSIPAGLGPVMGARHYAALLASIPAFDAVLLGLGEDGHTASLFPGDSALQSVHPALPVENAPKPPPRRISMSAARLANSRAVLFAVTGAEKRDALQRWREGSQIPAALVAPHDGVDIYHDQPIS